MLSLATPSSISRDLRTPSPRISALRTSPGSSTTMKTSVSPLVLPSADGELSKICGSLVEPENKRQQWSCHACKVIFPRDATIFLAPDRSGATTKALGDGADSLNRRLAATSAAQEHYCKSCYSDRYALGPCYACDRPVLGSTKEDGKFVKSGAGAEARIWHGRCWICTSCGAQSSEGEISIGMDGDPTCERCFDKPVARTANGAQAKSMPSPSSPAKAGNHTSFSFPASSLSAKSTRQGMGAAIAELSKKFGQPISTMASKAPSPVLPQHSGRQSPSRGMTRSNSITGRARPLTAQFSGQSFNLAAFQPSTLHRSDSRSRSASPTKQLEHDEIEQNGTQGVEICSKCFRGPFDGPVSATSGEARMISLRNCDTGVVMYHSECFRCAVCSKSLENAARSFVRLEDGDFAHPSCAPPSTVTRRLTKPTSIERPASMASSASSTDLDHATHQRLPRPTLDGERPKHNLPTSYLMAGLSDGKPISAVIPKQQQQQQGHSGTTVARPITEGISTKSSDAANSIRRFQPTSGAAPPTRSTLLHQRAPDRDTLNQVSASLAVSSGLRSSRTIGTANEAGRFAKLGGMHVCGGCHVAVSSLEGVPGPRGQSWHRKCLVCSAAPLRNERESPINLRYKSTSATQRCGKQLDSSAKVTAEGQLRCRECYDREKARHRVCV